LYQFLTIKSIRTMPTFTNYFPKKSALALATKALQCVMSGNENDLKFSLSININKNKERKKSNFPSNFHNSLYTTSYFFVALPQLLLSFNFP